ncbi:MAG TPA: hypothetical protein IGS40_14895 [Trichormus sp. M33_DOE_039]|nr:hypothetical protein [Trichormus sp. M33_DOE_039]
MITQYSLCLSSKIFVKRSPLNIFCQAIAFLLRKFTMSSEEGDHYA